MIAEMAFSYNLKTGIDTEDLYQEGRIAAWLYNGSHKAIKGAMVSYIHRHFGVAKRPQTAYPDTHLIKDCLYSCATKRHKHLVDSWVEIVEMTIRGVTPKEISLKLGIQADTVTNFKMIAKRWLSQDLPMYNWESMFKSRKGVSGNPSPRDRSPKGHLPVRSRVTAWRNPGCSSGKSSHYKPVVVDSYYPPEPCNLVNSSFWEVVHSVASDTEWVEMWKWAEGIQSTIDDSILRRIRDGFNVAQSNVQ